MTLFHITTIKNKIILMIMIVCSLIVGVGFTIVFISNIGEMKRNQVNSTRLNAKLIGEYCATSLSFKYPDRGEEILEKLASLPEIMNGYVFDNTPALFATYTKKGQSSIVPGMKTTPSYEFDGDYLHVWEPIVFMGERLGTIYLKALTSLSHRIRNQLIVMLSLILGLLALSFILAAMLQKMVSQPILKLAETALVVSEKKDYSIRAENEREDEIGRLIDSFNEMIAAIENRDSAIRESEWKYRTLIENLPLKIFYKDTDSIYIACNENYARDLGIESDQIKHKTDYDFFPKDLADKYRKDDKQVIQSGNTQSIVENYFHKNRLSIVQTIKTVVYDEKGGVTGLLGIFEDITEQKRNEEELTLFRKLIDQSSDAIFVIEPASGSFLDVNDTACHCLGYMRNEFLKMTANDIDIGAEPINWRKDELNSKDAPSLLYQRKRKYKRKDGSVFPVEITAKLVTIGPKEYSVVVARDLTEHENLEAQLRQSHKMEAIGTLAGGIAHDFNNLLAIIIGNIELALDDLPSTHPVCFNLNEVSTAALRARDVVSQLLRFARKKEERKKPVRIGTIVKDTYTLLRSSIPKNIDFQFNVTAQSDTVMADPTQINQVIINLCTNAAHAMPFGGLLSVKLKNIVLDSGRASIKHIAPGHYVQLLVSDTGHGIAEDHLDRIFDPYFTTKDVGKGTGMGLSIVHGIVKSHDGSIQVKSEFSKGSVFEVLFPVVEKQVTVEIMPASTLPIGDEKVLLVDDEVAIANMIRKMIERLGYHVMTKSNSADAFETFQENPNAFDLIITDMTMPGICGDELSLKILKIRPDIPIILCTGFSDKIDDDNAERLGVSALIKKPVTKEILAKMIRKVLDPATHNSG